MTTRNPFPGMNPFFEQRWRHAHTALIMYLCDTLQERLPPDLIAGAEEEVVTIGGNQPSAAYRPDVQVSEPWTLKETAAAAAPPMATEAPTATATEPIRVFVNEETERWLEIRESTGRLISVLELLSPSNKVESADREGYLSKRRRFINGGVNLVEIGLVRQGAPVFPIPVREVLQQATALYGVCVFRATRPGGYDVYPVRLRERLPVIRVPLRPTDSDVTVDLQRLIDQCHERGRFHLLNYRIPLDPPLSPEDTRWADELLHQHGLR